MATNNNGHLLDSGGNPVVDFAWGNFPLQPNDVRSATVPTVVVAANAAQNVGWSGYSTYPSQRLDFTLDNHVVAETEHAGFPAYIVPKATAMVTAASANGTTVSYTAQNNFVAGQTVSVTGLTTSAFNLSSVTVATANAVRFTVTNAATGTAVTGATGKAFDPTDITDGSYVSGTAYVTVPNVVGQTVALATDALLDAELGTLTVASAYTPAVTSVALTTNVATLLTGAAHGFAVGDIVVIAGLVDVSAAHYSDLNGTHTLTTGTTASTLKFAQTHTDLTVNTTTALSSATAKVAAKNGLVFSQSPAAGATTTTVGAAVTITPYYAS